MNTQIIAIANQKGGVGKTTTCANLGIGLAQAGKKVLLIDGDPQGSLTISLGNPQPDKLPFTLSDAMGKILMDQPIRPGEGILHHAEGVDLMPADIQLSGMEVSLVNAMSRETVLRQYLDTLKGQYSHILIDCQPSLGMLTVNALAAANRIIIPVQAEYLPAKGLEQLLSTVSKVKRQINPKLQIDGILLTMVDNRTNFAKEIAALLRDTAQNQEKDAFRLLDQRFLDTPAFAVEQCRQTTIQMAKLARECFFTAVDLLHGYDDEKAARVEALENLVDRYEDELGTYMVKLGGKNLSKSDSHTVSLLLHCIGDFERISDHGMNLKDSAKEMKEKEMQFSSKAEKELGIFFDAVKEILNLSIDAFETNNTDEAARVEPLEEVIDDINTVVKANHIRRLQKGKCTIEQGFVLSDISMNLERVSDHCSNIAVSVIEIDRDGFDTHGYLDNLKRDGDPHFAAMVEQYRGKYMLPV